MSENPTPSTELIAGLLVKSGENEWEIVSVSAPDARVKVHSCDDLFGRYLDAGAEYPLVQHRGHGEGEEVWEIMPEHMKRSASQVLLYVDDGDVTIDLDF